MKYFSIFVFLFLTLIANAQLTMEEIAYVPSASGYYNSLIVKGDVNIKELWTYPLNIQSYGSFLDVTIKNSGTAISSITVSTNTFVSLKNTYLPSGATPTHLVNMQMNGGKISLQQDNISNNNKYHLKIGDITKIYELSQGSTITYKTERFTYPDETTDISDIKALPVKNLYIMGMKVPYCNGKTKWIQANMLTSDVSFQVLYCDNAPAS